MIQNVLLGDIQITDNVDFVREMIFSNVPNTKIISIDEENRLPLEHPNVLGGAILLPPIDALIAEADGDEPLFDALYFNHFTDPSVEQFVVALMIYLRTPGSHLIIYVPDLQLTITKKLVDMFWKRYGIGIGIIGYSPCTYDVGCVPIWLGFIYAVHMMTPLELLYLYPLEALIPQAMMDQLLVEMMPYGNSYTEKVNYILDIRKKIKEKPNLKVPIFSTKG